MKNSFYIVKQQRHSPIMEYDNKGSGKSEFYIHTFSEEVLKSYNIINNEPLEANDTKN